MVQVFTQEECDKIIEHADLIGWEMGMCRGNTPKENDKSMGFKVSWVTLPWIYKGIHSYLKNEAGLIIKEGVKILVNRYLTGDRNFLHNDCLLHPGDPSDDTFITVAILLNSEFEGGEFIIQNKKVEQIVGYGYHHRSNIMHEITEITKGTRYSLLAFIKGNEIINPKTLI